MIQKYFPKNDAVSQDENAPINTAGTFQLWFEDYEYKFQHIPWPEGPPDLNIIEQLWLVLETRLGNKFPLPTPLKQVKILFMNNGVKFR
jgi:hypothetical protein